MEKHNIRILENHELLKINGGGFFKAAFNIFKQVVKYSSFGGALIVGLTDGAEEALEESQTSPDSGN